MSINSASQLRAALGDSLKPEIPSTTAGEPKPADESGVNPNTEGSPEVDDWVNPNNYDEAPDNPELADYLRTATMHVSQVQQAMNHFQALLNSSDMEALRTTNPGRYLLNEREIVGKINDLKAQHDDLVTEIALGDKIYKERDLNRAKKRLLTELPEWKDASTRSADQKQMLSWMKANGYSKEEIGAMTPDDVVRIKHKMTKAKKAPAPVKGNRQAHIKAKRAELRKQVFGF